MSKPTDDPFYTIRDEVRSQNELIRGRYERFLDMIKICDTYSNNEFKELRKGLVKDVRAVDKKIKGLKEAIDMVEKNRAKFAHIKESELTSRKKFVEEMQLSVNEVKAGMESPAVRRKMEDDENKGKRDSFDGAGGGVSRASLDREKENETFIKDQQQATKAAIKIQDANISALDQGVDRLHLIARDINSELKEQDVMLDDLSKDMDTAENKMNTVQAALSKLLKTKDGCQIWTIVILALILIILVALVIWT